MIGKFPQYIVIPFVVFAVVALGGLLFSLYRIGDDRAVKADQLYRTGETAVTVADRKKNFNEALSLYMQLDKDYSPRFGNGKLYYNLGNTYFQLEEYPWAILYYMRAQSLMPREARVERNLDLARSKLSLPASPESLWPASLKWSLPQRLQIFTCLALAALLLFSAWLWSGNAGLKSAAFVFTALAGILLASLGYSYYLSPVQGVLVQASDLYRDAGQQYAKIGDAPMPAGSRIEVLGTDPSEKWFKVITSSGQIGYVPQTTLRVVEADKN